MLSSSFSSSPPPPPPLGQCLMMTMMMMTYRAIFVELILHDKDHRLLTPPRNYQQIS
ncbi:MAG: hypothetical protein M3250_06935 [Thermoproteota archaeon]|nr:hypothetical protein [Thermoproteota archaeon]